MKPQDIELSTNQVKQHFRTGILLAIDLHRKREQAGESIDLLNDILEPIIEQITEEIDLSKYNAILEN